MKKVADFEETVPAIYWESPVISRVTAVFLHNGAVVVHMTEPCKGDSLRTIQLTEGAAHQLYLGLVEMWPVACERCAQAAAGVAR